MVAVLLDSGYNNSVWCKKIYDSLTEQLRQKRITFCEIFDVCPSNIDTVFVIASNLNWMTTTIKKLNSGGICPIVLCNQIESIPGCIYNCVCSDINASMQLLSNTLKNEGKKRIALYGINPKSIADICRTDSLMAFKNNHFEKMQIFTNNGSLENCFEEFSKIINEFDAAICANDLVAVSLVRNIKKTHPELLKNFSIISCASSGISEYYRDNIKSLDINYEQYGHAALYLYESIKKHSYLSGMIVKIVWTYDNKKPDLSRQDVLLDYCENIDEFYNDEELHEMLIVEKTISTADKTDKIILNGLIKNLTYEAISDKCFLTEGSVKYRIKNLVAASGAIDKTSMIKLLKKYINGKTII